MANKGKCVKVLEPHCRAGRRKQMTPCHMPVIPIKMHSNSFLFSSASLFHTSEQACLTTQCGNFKFTEQVSFLFAPASTWGCSSKPSPCAWNQALSPLTTLPCIAHIARDSKGAIWEAPCTDWGKAFSVAMLGFVENQTFQAPWWCCA